MQAYEILTGVGTLYVAPVGTAFPAVNAAPSGSWTNLGETVDGVKVTHDQKIEQMTTDQRTGPAVARRTEEYVMIETKLAQGTLENLAKVLGTTVTVGGSSKEITLYRGQVVQEYAFLFRGPSAYGSAFAAQYQLPRGYFDEAHEVEFTKDGQAVIPAKFVALEDLTAGTATDRYGKTVHQTA